MPRRIGWFVAAALAGIVPARAADLPPHPRLLIPPAALDSIRTRVAADSLLAVVHEATLRSAELALDRRTCGYRIPDGRRLLQESRHALDVVLHTGLAWRLTGDRRFLDRCAAEVDAATALPDWNPVHFLDVAEMATAVAIGFDWLHDAVAADRRERWRRALAEKAVNRAARDIEAQAGWTRVHTNWAQVCAGGIACAAAAVAETTADLEAGPFHECLRIVERCGDFYRPDGGYPEGPTYWDFGTTYHVLALAVAEGLGVAVDVPAELVASAAWITHVRGPTDLLFNFADAPAIRDRFFAARGWLVSRGAADDGTALAADLRAGIMRRAADLRERGGNHRFFPLHLAWLPPAPARPVELPRAGVFRGEQPVAAFRSAWNDSEAVFVAIKGGMPQVSHGHMDVGTFVLDAAGRRWVHDLGGDDYGLPGYFGPRRFDLFRLGARSHAVPLIDGRLPAAACDSCPIVAAEIAPEPGRPFTARIDLTPAYRTATGALAQDIQRELALDPASGQVTIRDTFAEPEGEIRWQAVISAAAELDGPRAVLRDAGQTLVVKARIEPAAEAGPHGHWRIEPARPPTAAENPNEGFRVLVVTCPRAARAVVEVTFTPGGR